MNITAEVLFQHNDEMQFLTTAGIGDLYIEARGKPVRIHLIAAQVQELISHLKYAGLINERQ